MRLPGWNRSPIQIFVRASLVALTLASTAKAQLLPDGFWEVREMKDYETYVRIEGDSGFYCVLDDKSSFAFAIVGDSITTPWDRLDGIVWFPGSGDIVISGVEKGEAYSTRFKPASSALYAAKCAEVENEYRVTGVRSSNPLARNRYPVWMESHRFHRDLLGRDVMQRSSPR